MFQVLLQVLFRDTHWLRFWAQLQKDEADGVLIKNVCRCLESVAMQFCVNFGWRFLSGTIIRGTLKTPNFQLVTPISIKLQRPDGCD
jgi:hypothetical protein